jgi:ABC-type amino acid transport substrate-binding protein
LSSRNWLIACLLLVVLALTACSSQGETQPQKENTPVPTNTSATDPTDVPEPTEEPTEETALEPQTMFSSDRAQQIFNAGVIRVGARNGSLPPFMLVEGSYSGFEVEVVEAMVDWLFAGAVEIEWVGITSGERFSGLS